MEARRGVGLCRTKEVRCAFTITFFMSILGLEFRGVATKKMGNCAYGFALYYNFSQTLGMHCLPAIMIWRTVHLQSYLLTVWRV